MIELRDKETGLVLGSISEEDLQFLVDNLVEESGDDTDYYLDRVTLDILKDRGGSENLMTVLEGAMGEKDNIEVEWSRD